MSVPVMKNKKICETCAEPATYRRACGHFYCETCPDLCDPITHRFNTRDGFWEECSEEAGEVYHVNIIVEGTNEDEVEAVSAAIDQMMHDQFEAFLSETVIDEEV